MQRRGKHSIRTREHPPRTITKPDIIGAEQPRQDEVRPQTQCACSALVTVIQRCWVFEFCSGLVDLVVCIRRHRRRGHFRALPGERFVSLLAEDMAEVRNRGIDIGMDAAVRGLKAKPEMVAAVS